MFDSHIKGFRLSAANIQQDFGNEKKNIKKVLKAEELNIVVFLYKKCTVDCFMIK